MAKKRDKNKDPLIVKAYVEDGLSLKEIAIKFGIGIKSPAMGHVRYILLENGVKLRPPYFTKRHRNIKRKYPYYRDPKEKSKT